MSQAALQNALAFGAHEDGADGGEVFAPDR